MRGFVAAALLGTGVALAAMGPSTAFAATGLTEPPRSPVVVTVDGSGKPAAFKVVAKGFEPYQSVFIEQCNGRPPSADHWQATVDCDLGSAPAPAIAGTDGVVTFLPTDPNHAFHPFVGASPQGLFNCLSPKGASPSNGMPDFRDCQIRVSSSNTAGTDDQVLLSLTLPAVSAAAGGAPSANAAGTSQSSPSQSSSGATSPAGTVTSQLAASHPESSSSSGSTVVVALLSIGAVAIGGASFFIHKRRSGRVAA